MDFCFIDWSLTLSYVEKIAIAYALALPIGWEREKTDRSAGLRTFPLVAMASCGYILIADKVLGNAPEARARIVAGVITGMGFIGGGAILKQGGTVSGTATAASIWNTGAVGFAVAFERYDIAVILSLINFITLRLLLPIKERVDKKRAARDGSGNTEEQER